MLINTNTVLVSQSTQTWSSRCSKNQGLWLMILLSTLKTLSFSEILHSCSKQLSSQSATGQGLSIIYHKQMELSGTVSVMWRKVWSSFQLRVFGWSNNNTPHWLQIIKMCHTNKREKCVVSREISSALFHFHSFWSCLLVNSFSLPGWWFSQTLCHHNLWVKRRRTRGSSNSRTCKRTRRIN